MKLDSQILTQSCRPAVFDNPAQNLQIAHQLLKLMQKEQGIGLAANQTGLDLRLFVMKIADRYFHCFNPEIIEYHNDLVVVNEGCLSFPNQHCEVTRPDTIRVRYYAANGAMTEEILSGWASRCFQHELDHLNGITMFDRLSK